MPLKIDIKEIMPGAIAPRARFNLGQIDIAVGQFRQDLRKRAGDMARREDQMRSCWGPAVRDSSCPSTKKRV